MFYATLLLAASATFSGFTAAQNTTSCCSIDPNSVNSTTRSLWCQAEQNTCPEVCGGLSKTKSNGNTCDLNTLQFTCECSDGTKPNMSDYQQSVPGQMCRQWFENCINNAPNDLMAQTNCKSVQCGNKTTKSQSTASASSGGGSGASATGGSGASSTSGSASSASSKAAADTIAIGREFGTPVLVAGILAAFGLAL